MSFQSTRYRRTSISVLALIYASPVVAQQRPSDESATPTPDQASAAPTPDQAVASDPDQTAGSSDIVVTGSRIRAPGLRSPTPVTSTSAEQLTTAAPTTISAGLNQLPQFRGSARPEAGGTNGNTAAGANQLNLRSLGVNRNLVLLDGRRVVPSSVNYVVDINTLPESLIERVDVVTGGASAAYGSDAVAGVVNFILNDKFDGLKVQAQAGISSVGDAASQKFALTIGTGIGANGHLIAAADYYRNGDIGVNDLSDRPWATRAAGIIPNVPTGTRPIRLLMADNVFVSNSTYGGLVTSGPLAGLAFGPDGTIEPYQFGTLRSATFQVGGTGGFRQPLNLSAGIERYTAFARYTHQLGDNARLFVEGSFGQSESRFDATYNAQYAGNSFVINRDNPFLPAEALSRMIAANVQTITVGRVHREPGLYTVHSRVRIGRGAIGFDADLSDRFSVKAHYSHGESRTFVETQNVADYGRIFAAVDAVRDPASGAIVCRVTLINNNFPGCVPFNPFGVGAPSQAAIDYSFGDQSRELRITQDVAAAEIQGALFSLWDSPWTFATGAEIRRETARQTVSESLTRVIDNTGVRGAPASIQGQVGPFAVGNPKPQSGNVTVKEAFLEVNAPIVSNVTMIRSLSLNGAVRVTDYSTSGSVTTWKVGAIYEPFTSLRFRATRSRDIRAATLGELNSGTVQQQGNILDPRSGGTFQFFGLASGNPNLTPEKANTWTLGVVLEPTFLPRFTISADYYDIRIEDAIGSLTAQVTVDECARGSAVACGNITTIGSVYRILLPSLNLNQLRVSGIDIEAAYRFPLLDGDVTLRSVANYQGTLETTTPGSVPINRAGEVGTTVGTGSPKWVGTFSTTYTNGPFTGFLQGRYLGPGTQNATYVEGVDIDDNSVPAVVYLDASIRYSIGEERNGIELYANVNNLLNKAPPLVPIATAAAIVNTNTVLYDTVGRYFTVGAIVKF